MTKVYRDIPRPAKRRNPQDERPRTEDGFLPSPHYTNFSERNKYRRENRRKAIKSEGRAVVREAKRLRSLYDGVFAHANDYVFNLCVPGTGLSYRGDDGGGES